MLDLTNLVPAHVNFVERNHLVVGDDLDYDGTRWKGDGCQSYVAQYFNGRLVGGAAGEVGRGGACWGGGWAKGRSCRGGAWWGGGRAIGGRRPGGCLYQKIESQKE